MLLVRPGLILGQETTLRPSSWSLMNKAVHHPYVIARRSRSEGHRQRIGRIDRIGGDVQILYVLDIRVGGVWDHENYDPGIVDRVRSAVGAKLDRYGLLRNYPGDLENGLRGLPDISRHLVADLAGAGSGRPIEGDPALPSIRNRTQAADVPLPPGGDYHILLGCSGRSELERNFVSIGRA